MTPATTITRESCLIELSLKNIQNFYHHYKCNVKIAILTVLSHFNLICYTSLRMGNGRSFQKNLNSLNIIG